MKEKPLQEDGADALLWGEHLYRERTDRVGARRAGQWSSEPDKAWIERGGHLGAKILGTAYESETHNWSMSNRQVTPERAVWEEVLLLAIADALGVKTGSTGRPLDKCLECHLAQECDCFYETPTKGWCRRPKTRCSKGFKGHTVRQCAQMWIASDACGDVCDILGINVSYLRKQIAKGALKPHVNQQKQRGQVQKLATKTLHPAGRPGEGRGSAGPSEMGGEICGGEAA